MAQGGRTVWGVAGLVVLVAGAVMCQRADNIEVTAEQACETARSFIENEPLQPFPDLSQLRYIADSEYPEIHVIGVSIKHAPSDSFVGSVNVESRTMQVKSFVAHQSKYIDLRKVKLLSAERAREIAEDCLVRYWPEYPNADEKPTAAEVEIRRGAYSFRWYEYVHAVLTTSAGVEIFAHSGKLRGFRLHFVRDRTGIPPPHMSSTRANELLTEKIIRKLKVGRDQIEVTQDPRRHSDPLRGAQSFHWNVSALIHQGDRVGVVCTYVVEKSGEVGPIEVRWHPATTPSPYVSLSADYHWPVWSPDGRMLISRARLLRWAGYPPWFAGVPRSLVLSEIESRNSYVVRPVPEEGKPTIQYRYAEFCGEDMRIVVALSLADIDLCTIDLRTGKTCGYTVHQRPELKRAAATRDAICFAKRQRSGDLDIAVARIPQEPSGPLTFRSLRVPGPDGRPVFSPDGQIVYFAHRDESESGPTGECRWQVLCARMNQGQLSEPELVAESFGLIDRISLFPDGKRMLVCHGDQLAVVDVNTGHRTPLQLPKLRDPERPDYRIVSITQAVVGPTGTRLAFRGSIRSANGAKTAGHPIYVCNLNGAELVRVTPLRTEGVPIYVFPATGREAFSVSDPINW